MFDVTKLWLSRIVTTGILVAFFTSKSVENFSEIIMYQDIAKTGRRNRLKVYTLYDIYYEVFEKIVAE